MESGAEGGYNSDLARTTSHTETIGNVESGAEGGYNNDLARTASHTEPTGNMESGAAAQDQNAGQWARAMFNVVELALKPDSMLLALESVLGQSWEHMEGMWCRECRCL